MKRTKRQRKLVDPPVTRIFFTEEEEAPAAALETTG